MVVPSWQPMPLIRVAEPFDDADWLFELKHDGFRALAIDSARLRMPRCIQPARRGRLAKGAPIAWVARQLGHAQVTTTLDFYSWALPDGNATLASLLDPVTSGDQTASSGGTEGS